MYDFRVPSRIGGFLGHFRSKCSVKRKTSLSLKYAIKFHPRNANGRGTKTVFVFDYFTNFVF